jgi:hypothetical protein
MTACIEKNMAEMGLTTHNISLMVRRGESKSPGAGKLWFGAAKAALNRCKHGIFGQNFVMSRRLVQCRTHPSYWRQGENPKHT